MIGILISIWTAITGHSAPPAPTNHILAESGDAILAENGDILTQE